MCLDCEPSGLADLQTVRYRVIEFVTSPCSVTTSAPCELSSMSIGSTTTDRSMMIMRVGSEGVTRTWAPRSEIHLRCLRVGSSLQALVR